MTANANRLRRRGRGRLVVFEGCDGAGKSTIVRCVEEALRQRGVDCVARAFPGAESGTVGQLVYRLHHEPEAFAVPELTPLSLQTLHVAAHVDAIERRIAPAIEAGTWVLLDRYWWSTWVYGRVAGVSAKRLTALIEFERLVWGKIKPVPVILVTRGPANTPLERTYSQLARSERQRVEVVTLSNDSTIQHARERVLDVLGIT